ncbi:MAG TPA: zinc metallopeptidase [Cyclobacteriaceae bacterium]|nr:zinc metallopeptidase [Cyclobacteriaceae bacterium]
MAFVIGGFFMLIGWLVQSRLKSKFKKYSEIHLTRDLTGAEVARLMLADHSIRDVQVMSVEGQLSDHYNPANKTVNLSPDVYHGRNAAATAVAAHECGHAVQHANAYSMLQLRSAMVPIQGVTTQIMNAIFWLSILGGGFLHILPWSTLILIVIACYGVFALFSLITLPVEFDASRRALAWVKTRNIVSPNEYDMAQDSLKWAAMTYVVAAISSITLLIYFVFQYMGGSRD